MLVLYSQRKYIQLFFENEQEPEAKTTKKKKSDGAECYKSPTNTANWSCHHGKLLVTQTISKAKNRFHFFSLQKISFSFQIYHFLSLFLFLSTLLLPSHFSYFSHWLRSVTIITNHLSFFTVSQLWVFWVLVREIRIFGLEFQWLLFHQIPCLRFAITHNATNQSQNHPGRVGCCLLESLPNFVIDARQCFHIYIYILLFGDSYSVLHSIFNFF